MVELLDNLPHSHALILTAPPGWGKTYKLLEAMKLSRESYLFVFPLRALCDEVYRSSLEKKIDVINIKSSDDLKLLSLKQHKLIVGTCETLLHLTDSEIRNRVVIWDEFHLLYYWGESFREKMWELYFKVTALEARFIALSATMSTELLSRTKYDFSFNYTDIIQINHGNQKLKNYPQKLFYYPKSKKEWLTEDYLIKAKAVTLIFCEFRHQVEEVKNKLERRDYSVLSCVGGEAAEFMAALVKLDGELDYIVATSVVSHGVNLPSISRIHFLYRVENLDFYIQMIGRGGRTGGSFECHTMNREYFSLNQIIMGFLRIIRKRLSNKVKNLIYYAYEY